MYLNKKSFFKKGILIELIINGSIKRKTKFFLISYHPEYLAHKYREINRRTSIEEMHAVKNYADDLGILYEPVS
jgi:uncharacterized Fe-S radical SAM superfamily protein PflX